MKIERVPEIDLRIPRRLLRAISKVSDLPENPIKWALLKELAVTLEFWNHPSFIATEPET